MRDDLSPAPPRPRPARRTPVSVPVDSGLLRSDLAAALGPPRDGRAAGRAVAAARLLAGGQLDDARRILAPIASEAPGAASIRELLGLTLYQLGRWRPAAKELEAFSALTGSVDHNPVLADCYRALGRHGDAERLWEELREVSPSAELMAEGRIVAAGSLADRGRLGDAVRLLESAPRGKKAREHHLRTAYALADLRERSGDLARARELFAWIASVDPDLADAAERLDALT